VYRGLKAGETGVSTAVSALAESRKVDYQEQGLIRPIDVLFAFWPSRKKTRQAGVWALKRTAQARKMGGVTVIWTTTPWTIPANQALNVHPEIVYRPRPIPTRGLLILAADRVEECLKAVRPHRFDHRDYDGCEVERPALSSSAERGAHPGY